ncbi:lasso peptide biosynthesis B2 protein [Aestuariibacter sp. GS-14]|nr:lasso peptide biosynthesis B2 protein [Aestuariibacter sp. GS-14]
MPKRAVFKSLSQFWALNSAQKKWFVRCWWQFAIWHIRIQYLPYHWWKMRLFNSLNNNSGRSLSFSLQDAIRLSEMAARHHVFRINCLRRCVVQQQLLAEYDYETTLHFGVAKQDSRLKAHCWLTHQGKLINDGPEVVSTYTELKLAGEQSQQILAALR